MQQVQKSEGRSATILAGILTSTVLERGGVDVGDGARLPSLPDGKVEPSLTLKGGLVTNTRPEDQLEASSTTNLTETPPIFIGRGGVTVGLGMELVAECFQPK